MHKAMQGLPRHTRPIVIAITLALALGMGTTAQAQQYSYPGTASSSGNAARANARSDAREAAATEIHDRYHASTGRNGGQRSNERQQPQQSERSSGSNGYGYANGTVHPIVAKPEQGYGRIREPSEPSGKPTHPQGTAQPQRGYGGSGYANGTVHPIVARPEQGYGRLREPSEKLVTPAHPQGTAQPQRDYGGSGYANGTVHPIVANPDPAYGRARKPERSSHEPGTVQPNRGNGYNYANGTVHPVRATHVPALNENYQSALRPQRTNPSMHPGEACGPGSPCAPGAQHEQSHSGSAPARPSYDNYSHAPMQRRGPTPQRMQQPALVSPKIPGEPSPCAPNLQNPDPCGHTGSGSGSKATGYGAGTSASTRAPIERRQENAIQPIRARQRPAVNPNIGRAVVTQKSNLNKQGQLNKNALSGGSQTSYTSQITGKQVPLGGPTTYTNAQGQKVTAGIQNPQNTNSLDGERINSGATYSNGVVTRTGSAPGQHVAGGFKGTGQGENAKGDHTNPNFQTGQTGPNAKYDGILHTHLPGDAGHPDNDIDSNGTQWVNGKVYDGTDANGTKWRDGHQVGGKVVTYKGSTKVTGVGDSPDVGNAQKGQGSLRELNGKYKTPGKRTGGDTDGGRTDNGGTGTAGPNGLQNSATGKYVTPVHPGQDNPSKDKYQKPLDQSKLTKNNVDPKVGGANNGGGG